jgi:hypothetical protein
MASHPFELRAIHGRSCLRIAFDIKVPAGVLPPPSIVSCIARTVLPEVGSLCVIALCSR